MAGDATDRIHLIGATVTFVRMDEGSTYELSEWEVEPGGEGPPIHIHHQHDEGFYVMAGHFGFLLDGITINAKPGAHVLVPMGHAHSFWNAGDQPGRCLLIVSPPGLEPYFRALSAGVGEMKTQQESIAIRKKLGEKYDMEIVEEARPKTKGRQQEG